MNQLISPNWHVILIHYPLALLGIGILIELGSFLWRKSSVRTAGRWMLMLGILSCIPTLTTGLYAYRQVAFKPQTSSAEPDLDKTYAELKLTPFGSATAEPYATWMWEHVKWEAVGTGILVFTLIVYMGASDRWRKMLYLPLLVLLLAGFAALTSGAWHAGESIYQYGVGETGPHEHKLNQAIFKTLTFKLQVHLLAAGWVVALGVAALAASIRALHDGGTTFADESWIDSTALGDEQGIDSHGNPVAPIEIDPRTEQPLAHNHYGIHAGPSKAPITTSRWWLLLTLVALCTAAGGLWILLGQKKWDWPTLQAILKHENRNLWHSIIGSSIIVLSLILALTTRLARRNVWVLSFFSLLMVVALAGQLWMGVLLLYDTSMGPNPQFWKLNPAEATAVAPAVTPAAVTP